MAGSGALAEPSHLFRVTGEERSWWLGTKQQQGLTRQKPPQPAATERLPTPGPQDRIFAIARGTRRVPTDTW